MSRKRLLEVLGENRAQHAVIFNEAQEGYVVARLDALRLVSDRAKEMRAGNLEYDYDALTDPLDDLNKPVHHLEAYDESIKMFEFDEVEQVFLKFSEFRKLVLDKWNWQGQFLAGNAKYSASATRRL